MITLPAYLVILVLSTLLTVIVIQWLTKARLYRRLIIFVGNALHRAFCPTE
jgi:hypothetical protein